MSSLSLTLTEFEVSLSSSFSQTFVGRRWHTFGEAKVDDVLACVKGAFPPLALRPLGKECFTFVGFQAWPEDQADGGKEYTRSWGEIYEDMMDNDQKLEDFCVHLWCL